MHRAAVVLVATIKLVAAEPQGGSISAVKLERAACHGTCPIYSLTIRSNGDVKYVGDEHVSVKGTRSAHITPHQFATLAAKAEKIRFFDLEDSYGGIKIGDAVVTVTDQPTTIVTVTHGGKAKRVRDYVGAPKGLYEFEQLIERIAGSERWTGRKDELQDAPYYDQFPLHRETTFRGVFRREWTGPLENLRVTGYDLELPKNSLTFTIHADQSIDPFKYCGDLVDASGVLDDNHVFHLTSIRSVRHVFDDKKPWP